MTEQLSIFDFLGEFANMPEEEKAIIQRLKKPNQQLEDHGWKYYICPVCQKEFSLIGKVGWAYKKKFGKNTYYFCDYTCMRKAEKLM